MRKDVKQAARDFLDLCNLDCATDLILKADSGGDGRYEALSEAYSAFWNAYAQTAPDTDPTAEEQDLKFHVERVFNILHAVWASDVGEYARIEFGHAIYHRLEKLREYLKK